METRAAPANQCSQSSSQSVGVLIAGPCCHPPSLSHCAEHKPKDGTRTRVQGGICTTPTCANLVGLWLWGFYQQLVPRGL